MKRVVGERADIVIEGLEFLDFNLPKLAGHKVTPGNVLDVIENEPNFFMNLPGRSGSHVMLGPTREGRFFYVALAASATPAIWRVVTAYPYSRRRALRYYRRAG